MSVDEFADESVRAFIGVMMLIRAMTDRRVTSLASRDERHKFWSIRRRRNREEDEKRDGANDSREQRRRGRRVMGWKCI